MKKIDLEELLRTIEWNNSYKQFLEEYEEIRDLHGKHVEGDREKLELFNQFLFKKYIKATQLISELKEKIEGYEQKVSELTRRVEKYEIRIEALASPPLQYGTFLKFGPKKRVKTESREGISEAELQTAEVKIDGKRREVYIDPHIDSKIVESLKQGTEVKINAALNIVDVADRFSYGEVVKVREILEGNRILVNWGHDQEKVVGIGPELKGKRVRTGDNLRLDIGSGFVHEILPKIEVEDFGLREVPDVAYEDIGGLDRQVEQVKRLIERPFLYPEIYQEYKKKLSKGVLLYGPPGCGKTLIGKAVANSLSKRVRERNSKIKELIGIYKTQKGEGLDKELFQFYNDVIPDDAELTHEQMLDLYNKKYHKISLKRFEEKFIEPSLKGNLFEKITTKGRIYKFKKIPLEERRNNLERIERYLVNNHIDIHNLDKEYDKLSARSGEEFRGYFLYVPGPALLNMYVGQTEKNIRDLFDRAVQKADEGIPVVIFFDEMDSLFGIRTEHTSISMNRTTVGQLLPLMDGISERDNIIVIGASNRHELIDPAVLRDGRFDAKIRIDRPHESGSREIFKLYLTPDLPVEQGLVKQYKGKEQAIDYLISKSIEKIFATTPENRYIKAIFRDGTSKVFYYKDFISGAIIERIVESAKENAIDRKIKDMELAHDELEREIIKNKVYGISYEDLEKAINERFKENEDLPSTLNPSDWAKIMDMEGKIVERVEPIFKKEQAIYKKIELRPSGDKI